LVQHKGLFTVPLRWVLVRHPKVEFATQALLCSDLEADPLKILSWFVMRWQLEVTFQKVRGPKGVRDSEAVVGFGGAKGHSSPSCISFEISMPS